MILLKEEKQYDFNYLLDKYEIPDYDKYKGNKKVLYHNTRPLMIDDISKHGLLCSKATAEKNELGVIPMIWAVTVGGGNGYGGCTIAFINNAESYRKVNNTEYTIYEDIPPQDILFIDTWIEPTATYGRVSDIKKYIVKMGLDRVQKTLHKAEERGLQFYYDIDYLLEKLQ